MFAPVSCAAVTRCVAPDAVPDTARSACAGDAAGVCTDGVVGVGADGVVGFGAVFADGLGDVCAVFAVEEDAGLAYASCGAVVAKAPMAVVHIPTLNITDKTAFVLFPCFMRNSPIPYPGDEFVN